MTDRQAPLFLRAKRILDNDQSYWFPDDLIECARVVVALKVTSYEPVTGDVFVDAESGPRAVVNFDPVEPDAAWWDAALSGRLREVRS